MGNILDHCEALAQLQQQGSQIQVLALLGEGQVMEYCVVQGEVQGEV